MILPCYGRKSGNEQNSKIEYSTIGSICCVSWPLCVTCVSPAILLDLCHLIGLVQSRDDKACNQRCLLALIHCPDSKSIASWRDEDRGTGIAQHSTETAGSRQPRSRHTATSNNPRLTLTASRTGNSQSARFSWLNPSLIDMQKTVIYNPARSWVSR